MTEAIQLRRVRLNLARREDFPSGSSRHGYEFVAPLDAEGHIDAKAWRKVRERCTVRRFWEGEPDEHGHLVHRAGGSWAFHYDDDADEQDEPGYRFASHAFNPGEYVSIKDDEDELVTFQVATVERV